MKNRLGSSRANSTYTLDKTVGEAHISSSLVRKLNFIVEIKRLAEAVKIKDMKLGDCPPTMKHVSSRFTVPSDEKLLWNGTQR